MSQLRFPSRKRKRDQVVPSDDMRTIYDPLDTDFNEIRLLTLLSQDTKVIHCTLEHVSLINPPEYVALSYCWGDPAATKEISINGAAVQVTWNLESALRHLRAKGYGRLWVDAVCINQQDKTERSQLLLWMGSIYRRAEEVVAWTGEDFDLAIDFTNRLNSLNKSRSASPTAHDIREATLLELLARPYWKRVWIIQELALARRITIHCGRLETSWSALNSSIHKLDNCGENSDIINIRNLAEFRDDAAQNRPLNFLGMFQPQSPHMDQCFRQNKLFVRNGTFNGGRFLELIPYSCSKANLTLSSSRGIETELCSSVNRTP